MTPRIGRSVQLPGPEPAVGVWRLFGVRQPTGGAAVGSRLTLSDDNRLLNNYTRRLDPRNGLYVRVARAAEVLRPMSVVIENVPAIRHARTLTSRPARAIRLRRPVTPTEDRSPALIATRRGAAGLLITTRACDHHHGAVT